MKMTNSILRLRKKPNGRYVEEGRLVEWVDNVEESCPGACAIPHREDISPGPGLFRGWPAYASLGDLQCHREGDYFFRGPYGHRVLEVREPISLF